MKSIERIKFICGLILISFAIIIGIIFYLESFKIIDEILNNANLSYIFRRGYGDGSGSSQTTIFIGLCGLAGAYLLASVNQTNVKNKTDLQG